jgi:hypothetical protein
LCWVQTVPGILLITINGDLAHISTPPLLCLHISLSQLDVKGCFNIYESFNKLTETEVLTGPNQYRAEGYGLQVGQTLLKYVDSRPACQEHGATHGYADPHSKETKRSSMFIDPR